LTYRCRSGSCDLTRSWAGSLCASVRSCSEWGLHSRFRRRKRGALLPRLSTLTDKFSSVGGLFLLHVLGVASTGR